MKQFKKLIACVLAATLVLGSTTVFFGAEKKTSDEGSFGGNGNFEGSVDTEIFNVVVPVESVTSGSAFDFVLDPEGLINTTSGAAYDGVTFVTSGTMYFKVSDTQYDVKSQTLTAKNLSSTDVNITLDAKVTVPTSNAALTLAEDNVWETSDTALEVYFEIVEVSGGAVVTSAAIATEESDNVYTGGLESTLASYAEAYEVIFNTTADAYEYVINEDLNVEADTYEFYLTGACNTYADWSEYDKDYNPEISVVWKVEMVGVETDGEDDGEDETPVVTSINNGKTTADYSKSKGVTIPYTLAKGVSITGYKAGKDAASAGDVASYITDNKDGTFTYSGLWTNLTNGQTRVLVIELSNDTSVTITLTIKS